MGVQVCDKICSLYPSISVSRGTQVCLSSKDDSSAPIKRPRDASESFSEFVEPKVKRIDATTKIAECLNDKPSILSPAHEKLLSDRPRPDMLVPDRKIENFPSFAARQRCQIVGNRIIDVQMLFQGLIMDFNLKCPCGESSGLVLCETGAPSMYGNLHFSCQLCQRFQIVRIARLSRNFVPDIAYRSVVAARLVGLGRQGLAKLFAVLNCPAPAKKFDQHLKTVLPYAQTECENSMSFAAAEIRAFRQKEYQIVQDVDAPLDMCVSYDGTYHSQGRMSSIGVFRMISAEHGLPGKVVDQVIFNRVCEVHKAAKKAGKEAELCDHRCHGVGEYMGSAQAMEADAAVVLAKRSIGMRGIRYSSISMDGDSKTFSSLGLAKPYGSDFSIQRLQDPGHLAKRTGETLYKMAKSTTLSDGKKGNGKGRFTQSCQDFFKSSIRAICVTAKTTEEAKSRILALAYHEGNDHSMCPDSTEDSISWCKVKNGEKSSSSYAFGKVVLHELVVPALELSILNGNVLEQSINAPHTNTNEASHHQLWKMAPKKLRVGHHEMDLAACLSTLAWNDGYWSVKMIFQHMGIQPGELFDKGLVEYDIKRANNGDRQVSTEYKKKRVQWKKSRYAQHNQQSKNDGVSYNPGAFIPGFGGSRDLELDFESDVE